MAAPEWFHLRHGEFAYPKDVYKNDGMSLSIPFVMCTVEHHATDEYFADIAVAYQAEIQDLYAAGCRNIQIDDPLLAYFCAESMIKGMEERGVDHVALLNTYIKAYNDCLKNRPADMNVGLHLCRGNFKVRFCRALISHRCIHRHNGVERPLFQRGRLRPDCD